MRPATEERIAREPNRADAARSFESWLVWALVVSVAFIVPGILYYFLFSPPAQLGPALVVGGLITFFWLLFSLVNFDDLSGRPVRWPKRFAILVGGELLAGARMWGIFWVRGSY